MKLGRSRKAEKRQIGVPTVHTLDRVACGSNIHWTACVTSRYVAAERAARKANRSWAVSCGCCHNEGLTSTTFLSQNEHLRPVRIWVQASEIWKRVSLHCQLSGRPTRPAVHTSINILTASSRFLIAYVSCQHCTSAVAICCCLSAAT